MKDTPADALLDVQGLMCPEPVMMLHSKMDELAEGQVLLVKATDPSTQRDIPKFCQFLNNKLVEQGEHEGVYFYVIQKGGG